MTGRASANSIAQRRIPPLLGSALLAAGTVAANESPPLDDDLLGCLGTIDAAVSLEMALSVGDVNLSREIENALGDHQTTRFALITRLWEQTNCSVEYQDLLDAMEDANRTAMRPVLAAIGERDELSAIWNELQPRLACASTLNEGELERARVMSESGTGYPCGWQP